MFFDIPDSNRQILDENQHISAKIFTHKQEFFEIIAKYAPKYPVETLAKVDVSILLLSLFELLKEEHKQPEKVIINEAVELAKELGNENSPAFINGVLGAVVDELKKEKNDRQTI